MKYLREESGEHTCDKRLPRSTIARSFPPPIYDFEEGFSEEDTFWKADERETKAHVAERAAQVLDRIFTSDKETCEQSIPLEDGLSHQLTVFAWRYLPLCTQRHHQRLLEIYGSTSALWTNNGRCALSFWTY